MCAILTTTVSFAKCPSSVNQVITKVVPYSYKTGEFIGSGYNWYYWLENNKGLAIKILVTQYNSVVSRQGLFNDFDSDDLRVLPQKVVDIDKTLQKFISDDTKLQVNIKVKEGSCLYLTGGEPRPTLADNIEEISIKKIK